MYYMFCSSKSTRWPVIIFLIAFVILFIFSDVSHYCVLDDVCVAKVSDIDTSSSSDYSQTKKNVVLLNINTTRPLVISWYVSWGPNAYYKIVRAIYIERIYYATNIGFVPNL
jgi:hypothetical protein